MIGKLGAMLAALAFGLVDNAVAQTVPTMSDPKPEGHRVADGQLLGNFYPAAKRAPGILLIGGSEGGLDVGLTRAARALQQSGFSVLHLSYWGGPGQSAALEHIPIELFEQGLRWLRDQPEVEGRRLGVLGWSRGSEPTLLLAARPPHGLRAVVAVAPSSVLWAGYSDDPAARLDSAWTRDGKPLPMLNRPGDDPNGDTMAIATRLLALLPVRPDAAIPTPKRAVLLVCGESDLLWPSCNMARDYMARNGRQTQLLAYHDAGHIVFGPPRAPDDPLVAKMTAMGGTGPGNNAARADAWPKIIAFLNARLLDDHINLHAAMVHTDPRSH